MVHVEPNGQSSLKGHITRFSSQMQFLLREGKENRRDILWNPAKRMISMMQDVNCHRQKLSDLKQQTASWRGKKFMVTENDNKMELVVKVDSEVPSDFFMRRKVKDLVVKSK